MVAGRMDAGERRAPSDESPRHAEELPRHRRRTVTPAAAPCPRQTVADCMAPGFDCTGAAPEHSGLEIETRSRFRQTRTMISLRCTGLTYRRQPCVSFGCSEPPTSAAQGPGFVVRCQSGPTACSVRCRHSTVLFAVHGPRPETVASAAGTVVAAHGGERDVKDEIHSRSRLVRCREHTGAGRSRAAARSRDRAKNSFPGWGNR